MTTIELRTTRFDDPVARTLVAAALADLGARYGGSGDETPVHPDEFAPPAGNFLVAWVDGVPAGCGGWRTLADDDAVAEIKRMYTAPEWRGRGVASAVLRAIEESAREAGKKRTVLETGDRQPEAIALYRRLGYERIPNFGFYKDSPDCLSFGRLL
ncbi:GNAT family N-acetyltransferase [Planosporangium sp. 12N6]|uniref:GNAT family N-acetyltransferase n=1 Tax=Planosporangium spinosum TaxID=3402278 RepID=UPI003CECD5CF